MLEADFICFVCYPKWQANMVMVRKGDGGRRICVDFTNLNKACPHDSYPLSSVNAMVDKILGCYLLSFMDVHSG